MQIEHLSLKSVFNKNGVFLFGNNTDFIASFIRIVKKFFDDQFNFIEVLDIKNKISFIQNDLFNKKSTCLIINGIEDKSQKYFDELTKNRKFIATQGNFLKSKIIAKCMQQNTNVIALPFFKNSLQGYITFLLRNLGHQENHVKLIIDEYISSSEDPFSIINKLADVDFKRLTQDNTSKYFAGTDPIAVMKILMSYVKKSYGNMEPILNSKSYTDRDLLETFLNSEIEYKSKNLKSKIFLQKEFLQ